MSILKKIFKSKEKNCCSIKIEEVTENKTDSNAKDKDNKSQCCK